MVCLSFGFPVQLCFESDVVRPKINQCTTTDLCAIRSDLVLVLLGDGRFTLFDQTFALGGPLLLQGRKQRLRLDVLAQ